MAHEWGHWLTLILAACFVRKEDYLWLKAKFRLAPKCGCQQREESLNQAGATVSRRLKTIWQTLTSWLPWPSLKRIHQITTRLLSWLPYNSPNRKDA